MVPYGIQNAQVEMTLMSLTTEDVRHIAYLARLALEPTEVESFAGSLTEIFQFVDTINNADIEGVAPMAHPLDAAQRLRPDAVTEVDQRDHFQAQAPAVERGLYLVPRVIE